MWYYLSIPICGLSLIILGITHWVYKWRNPKCNGILPPGSMGIPIIGETLHFYKPSYSLDILPFFKHRIKRYGSLFRTNLVGRPMVVSTDPEVNNFVLQQEGKLVEMWYLGSFGELFKQDGSTNGGGAIHRYLRTLIMNQFGSDTLKDKLLSKVENMARATLHTWSTQHSVEVYHSTSLMIFDFITMELFSYDQNKTSYKMSEAFINFSDGLMSFPFNIPGSTFHRCAQNQKKTLKIMKDVIKERLGSGSGSGSGKNEDLLSSLMEGMGDKEFVTEDFVVYIMFGLLFASFESIPSVITLAIKLLTDNPSVLQDLKEEHEAIIGSRKVPNSSITWAEYKSMKFTQQVINEILRMANVGPGSFRRALKDITINGYTIPAGWSILVVPSATHMDPSIYNDPLTFNPKRWKDGEGRKKNFAPFGGGIRSCAGADFSRMLMAVFLHLLVTNYQWVKVKEGKIIRNPFLRFGEGFHVKDLKEEHEAIIGSRKVPNSSITWAEYKSMKFTQQVINEILRMANVGPGSFRRALKDITINGYTIPVEWSILLVLSATHMDPSIYDDHLTFNPKRWKDGQGRKKNFAPFGGGIRSCAGADFSRMLMVVFLHLLVAITNN